MPGGRLPSRDGDGACAKYQVPGARIVGRVVRGHPHPTLWSADAQFRAKRRCLVVTHPRRDFRFQISDCRLRIGDWWGTRYPLGWRNLKCARRAGPKGGPRPEVSSNPADSCASGRPAVRLRARSGDLRPACSGDLRPACSGDLRPACGLGRETFALRARETFAQRARETFALRDLRPACEDAPSQGSPAR